MESEYGNILENGGVFEGAAGQDPDRHQQFAFFGPEHRTQDRRVPFPGQRARQLGRAIDRAHSETRSGFRSREKPIRSWPIPAVNNRVHRAAVLGTPLDDPRVLHPRLATRLPRYCLLEAAATQLSQRYALTSGSRPRLGIQLRVHRYLRPDHVITLPHGDNTGQARAWRAPLRLLRRDRECWTLAALACQPMLGFGGG